MNKSRNGVRQPRATTGERPTTATTCSSRPAASRVWRMVGRVSNSPVTGSTMVGVVVLPAGLMLLGAVVMVDGVDHRSRLLRGRAQHDGRLAAVGADLDPDTAAQVAHGGVVEGAALVGGHEAGDLLGEVRTGAAASRGQGGVSGAHGMHNLPLLVMGGCSSVRTRVRCGPGVDAPPR